MQHVLIAGAGKIGATIARFLAHTGDYHVHLVDVNIERAHPHAQHHHLDNLTLHQLDISNTHNARDFIQKNQINALISCLPYQFTIALAKLAKDTESHYFDLTEDTHTTEIVDELARDSKQAFAPQCGLAPGFIDIVANNLILKFKQCDQVKLRCGALPQDTGNALQYALTWSTDGLINEYGNPCAVLENHQIITSPALDDLEALQIDGGHYEAFNTSGGIGSLLQCYQNRVENMSYKTIRYPGHCEKMRFLMQGLKLNHDRNTLKRILENAIPTTQQDVVIVYVSATGQRNGQLTRESYVKKFYPARLADIECNAIQATTASGACAVIDKVLQNPKTFSGIIKHEDIALDDLLQNRFGQYFNA